MTRTLRYWLVLPLLCGGALVADAQTDRQTQINRILANQEICKHAK